MNKKRLPYIITSMLILIIITAGCFYIIDTEPSYDIIAMEQGWKVQVNDRIIEDVSVSRFYEIPDLKMYRGDHIILSHTLPEYEVANPVILFRTKYTTLKCYVNGRLIHEYGEDYYNRKKFLGKMYHFISLPSDCSGKEIIFDMYAAENRPFEHLEAPEFGSQPDITDKFVRDNFFVITTGLFMFVFGLIFLCIAMIFTTYVPEVISLLFGSLLCMNLSAWLLTYYNILSLFIYTETETEIEYFTMYLIVPYCFAITYFIGKLKGNRLFTGLLLMCCGVPVMQYILHYVFNIHLRTTLSLYHISGVIGLSVLVYYAFLVIQKKVAASTDTIIQLTGLLFFAISDFLQLIIYICDMLHIPTNPSIDKAIICLGCLIFAWAQLATYLIFITETYAKKQENISLSHLAYADGLTDLANRSKSDKLMEELNDTTDDYCILSIDLNGLKEVNDKFGHPTGDRYIRDFAKVLNNTFGDTDFCARIGGDEFIVVIRDASSKDVNALIGRMNSALNVMNALYTEYKRSVSVGFAFRHEIKENNSHEVYLMADQRMYENKRKMHKEMGVIPRL